MSDEYNKLVARIQHFYDVMHHRVGEYAEGLLKEEIDNAERSSYKNKFQELTEIRHLYSNIFDNFIYVEMEEK